MVVLFPLFYLAVAVSKIYVLKSPKSPQHAYSHSNRIFLKSNFYASFSLLQSTLTGLTTMKQNLKYVTARSVNARKIGNLEGADSKSYSHMSLSSAERDRHGACGFDVHIGDFVPATVSASACQSSCLVSGPRLAVIQRKTRIISQ